MSYHAQKIDKRLVGLLIGGAVGLMPSDTIYGLSCCALDPSAVKRLHYIKRRDKSKPFIVLISGPDQLPALGIKPSAIEAAQPYWPGKLTVICEAPEAPAWLEMGTKTLAVRQPEPAQLLGLLRQTGPLISTSANIQGDEPAINTAEAEAYFGQKIDFYVGHGSLNGQPSTIVKPMSGKLKVIRQGAVRIRREDLYDAR